MTGFALGDKFIGVSTDNIYTKQELDTKLQDKQDTLTAGQGIDISEDGTISVDVTSAGFGLGAQAPLQYTSAQYATSVEINKEAGTFIRKLTLPSTSARETPYRGVGQSTSKWYLPGTYSSDNQTVTIDTAQTLYAECPTTSNVTFRFDPPFNDTSYGSRACVIFGYKDENGNITHLGNVTYTVSTTTHTLHGGYQTVSSLVSKGGIYTQESNGISEMVIAFDQHLENLSTNQIPTENFYIILRAYRQGSTGNQMYYICFKDATTDETIYNEGFMVSEQMPDLNFFCLSTTDDVAYPITGRARVVGDDRPNEYVWTVKDGVSPNTLKLNYDGSLTLDSSNNLKVNVENLGLATVATTGSYTDLTNTPEEYVLPTASTDTLGGVKVDGTSIVIAEGVISTNTGTEVDTYTKTEIDSKLDEKQHVLNPAAPLSIEAVQINPSNNMTVLDTGDIVSSNEAWVNNPNSDKTTFNYNAGSEDGVYTFVQNASFDYVQKQLGCMVFPFTYGNIYTVPLCSNTARDTFQPPAIALGYYDADATFIPVFTTTLSADEWALFTNTTAIETEPVWDVWGFVSSSEGVYTNREGLGQPSSPWIPKYYTMYFQIFKKTDGNYSFTNVTHYSNHLTSYKGDFNSTMNEYLNKCTHIMLCAWSTNDAGIGVNNGIGAPAYNLSNNTYNFAYSGNLAEDIEADTFNYDNLVATSENLFKFEVINNTVLALNIDNNTIKVNENNQLYADIDTTAAVATADTAGIVRPTGDVLSVNAEGDLSADTYNTSTLDTKFEEKQDTLTATNGISIERKTISNVEGFSYTSDSSAIYNTGGWGVGAPLGQNWTVYQVPGIADLVGTSMTATTFPNRIVMPYTFGQIVKYPSIYAYRPINIAFGKLAEDGTFYPIWFPGNNRYYYKSDDNIIQKSGNFEQIHFYSYADWGQSPENDKTDVFTYNNSVQYMQLKVTDSDLKLNYTYGVSNHSYMRQYYKTDVSILNRFKEVNAIMIIPYYQIYSASSEIIGVNIDSAIPVTSIGLYTNTMDLYDSAEQLDGYDFGENLFDIGGVQAHNYISINTDNSTIKVNGSGQLYANIELPENVITSDNISTNAYIQQLEQRITALESLIDGGNSLGEIITNTVIQTAGTPAGGQNSGYVGTQTITVQDLETS